MAENHPFRLIKKVIEKSIFALENSDPDTIEKKTTKTTKTKIIIILIKIKKQKKQKKRTKR